jgi:hypothetical protein
MLYVPASGQTRFLQKSPIWRLGASASLDGRYLAYTQTTAESNAWMIDNLP